MNAVSFYETKLTANVCIALCSSTHAVSFSSARTTKRFPIAAMCVNNPDRPPLTING